MLGDGHQNLNNTEAIKCIVTLHQAEKSSGLAAAHPEDHVGPFLLLIKKNTCWVDHENMKLFRYKVHLLCL